MSTIKVNKIENIATGNGGVEIDNTGHVKVDGVQLPTSGAFGGRNLIINGNFDVWQRGTAKSYSISSSHYNTADRWLMRTTGSANVTVSQQAFSVGQTDVPNNPRYFYRWNTTSYTSGQGRTENRIEDVTRTSGQTLTISFWAKADQNCTIEPRYSQNFGTNGSANVTVAGSAGSFNLTTAWQKFTETITLGSVSGKTLGAGHCLEVRIQFPMAVSIVDIAQVQLEVGVMATPFETRTYGDELIKCQRYFTKIAWALCNPMYGIAYRVITPGPSIPMRAAPEVAYFHPSSGTANNTYEHSSATARVINSVVNTSDIAGTTTYFGMSSAATYGQYVTIHYSSEL